MDNKNKRLKANERFINVPLKKLSWISVNLEEKEAIIAEKISDAVYYKLVKKLRHYKNGYLALRVFGTKQYSIEFGKDIFYYCVSWGVKGEKQTPKRNL